MVASAVFITDLQGKSIISRNYRGDIPLNKAIESFGRYLDQTEEENRKPIFYLHHGDFYVEEDVGETGPGGETFVYVNVRLLVVDSFFRFRVLASSGRCDDFSFSSIHFSLFYAPSLFALSTNAE